MQTAQRTPVTTQPLRQLRRRYRTIEQAACDLADLLLGIAQFSTDVEQRAMIAEHLAQFRNAQVAAAHPLPRALALVCDAGCQRTYSADPAAYPRLAGAQVLHCDCGSALHLAYVNEREERIVKHAARRHDLDTPRPLIENL